MFLSSQDLPRRAHELPGMQSNNLINKIVRKKTPTVPCAISLAGAVRIS